MLERSSQYYCEQKKINSKRVEFNKNHLNKFYFYFIDNFNFNNK